MMIASLGPCLPVDLLEATGRHAGQLAWRLGEQTPHADQWLESKFPPWSRSIVEQWATGRFDEFDTVVFSRGDDGLAYFQLHARPALRRAGVRDFVQHVVVEGAGHTFRPRAAQAELRKLLIDFVKRIG